jgi:ATP synthase subunit 6
MVMGYIEINNVMINMVIVMGIIIGIGEMMTVKIVPGKIQIVKEGMIGMVWEMVKENIGEKVYVMILVPLMEILLIFNVVGMISHSYPTTGITIIPMTISLIIWLTVLIEGIRNYGKEYLSMFFPMGAPMWLAPLIVGIEIISYLARAISLGVRLSANITSGHVLIGIISGFVWQMLTSTIWPVGIVGVILMIALTTLELGVAIIQGYVFVLIGSLYLGDGYRLH